MGLTCSSPCSESVRKVNAEFMIVNLRTVCDRESWVKDKDKNIHIGCKTSNLKQSKWANPFKVSIYGRQKAVSLYEKYVRGNEELQAAIAKGELKGKCLGCRCFPKLCHGKFSNVWTLRWKVLCQLLHHKSSTTESMLETLTQRQWLPI